MDQTIQFVEARSNDLKRAIHRLRYQIYVEECSFERPEAHPSGLEMDEYDAHSIHFAALSDDNKVIGTVRIIMHSKKGFPIEQAAETRFIGRKPSPERIVEISRLALLPAYRRRAEHDPYDAEFYFQGGIRPGDGERSAQYVKIKRSVVVLSLIGLVYEKIKRLGVTHVYMVTEKKLWRMLNRHGFLFHQIGEPIEYHGVRIPYLGVITEMEDHALQTNQELMMHPAFRIGLEEAACHSHETCYNDSSLALDHHKAGSPGGSFTMSTAK